MIHLSLHIFIFVNNWKLGTKICLKNVNYQWYFEILFRWETQFQPLSFQVTFQKNWTFAYFTAVLPDKTPFAILIFLIVVMFNTLFLYITIIRWYVILVLLISETALS